MAHPINLLINPNRKTIVVFSEGFLKEQHGATRALVHAVKYNFSGEKVFQGTICCVDRPNPMATRLCPIDFDGCFSIGHYKQSLTQYLLTFDEKTNESVALRDPEGGVHDHLHWKSAYSIYRAATGWNEQHIYLGNEMYVVVVVPRQRAIWVLCFDPHVRLAESDWEANGRELGKTGILYS